MKEWYLSVIDEPGGQQRPATREEVEQFTLLAGTLVHVGGIPCRLVNHTPIETNPDNVPLIVGSGTLVAPGDWTPPEANG